MRQKCTVHIPNCREKHDSSTQTEQPHTVYRELALLKLQWACVPEHLAEDKSGPNLDIPSFLLSLDRGSSKLNSISPPETLVGGHHCEKR